MTIYRNARLAATTLVRQLDDDPVMLMLQMSRRFPVKLVRHAASIIRHAPGPVAKGLGAHLMGMTEERDRTIDDALRRGVTGATAARLADLALVANDPDRGDRLLAAAGSAAGARARRRWYGGDMTGAVAEVSTGRHRKAQRLQSELRVFQGWTPVLERATGYLPQDRTVLHVLTNSLPHTGSGYAQRSHSILSAQSELGWSVHAATRLGYPVQIGKLVAKHKDELDGVTYHRLLPARLPTGFDQRLQVQAESLLQLALKVRPTLLHTTTHFVNGLVTRAVAEALGIPWVYEVRGQLADTWASTRSGDATFSERYELFTERETAVMRSADLVITLGEVMKQRILEVGGVRREILLSPNGVGEHFLEDPLESRTAREVLGLPADSVFVGSVSSLVDYEGLDVLIRAVALLANDRPYLRCLIVGDGVAAPRLRRLAHQLGVGTRVIFTGRVPREQAHLYHQALDVFVLPRNDVQVTRTVTPLKPVEAMASARPVVASNLPALREIVEDSVTGKLVEAGSVEALAEALSTMTDSQGLRVTSSAVAMGAAGRERVLADRTWLRSSRSVLDAYSDLGVAGK